MSNVTFFHPRRKPGVLTMAEQITAVFTYHLDELAPAVPDKDRVGRPRVFPAYLLLGYGVLIRIMPRPLGSFTGAHFERLGGGGDRPSVADEFTAEDLIAVSMFSVAVLGDAAFKVLELRRQRLSELLRQILTDTALADLDTDALGPDWPVRTLYRELVTVRDVGETTATKLLARKRPHLVPILDSVVTKELGIVKGKFWVPLHAWLVTDKRANHHHLGYLRSLAGLGDDISTLRVFDVLAWMAGKAHTAS